MGKRANDGSGFENEFRVPMKHVDGDVQVEISRARS